MNELLSKVKMKNQETFKKGSTILFKLEGIMVLLAIILLIINRDQFLTPAVLLIFIAFILFMISVFKMAMYATKNQNIKIKNNIDIIYQYYINIFNDNHKTTYRFETDHNEDNDWYLIPSYAQKDIDYCLHDEDKQIKMCYAQTYTAAGYPPRRTTYFSGLYVILKGVEGDMQYRDQDGISGNIINAFKSAYGTDQHDVDQYNKKSRYESGIFYSQEQEEIPDFVKTLLSTLRLKRFVSRLSVAIKNGELHVAIEQKSDRLPYVRKYQDEELDDIKKVVEENATMLMDIELVIKEK